MRLGLFIEGNLEPILAEWETFARGIARTGKMDSLALRDHAAEILRATVQDMRSTQSSQEQSAKSKGHADLHDQTDALNEASAEHAISRLGDGFDLLEVVSEYRALRASVLRLWREEACELDATDLEDATRFNEAIDELITKAVRSFTKKVDQARDMFLAILSHDLRNPLAAIGMTAEVLPLVASAEYTKKYAEQISGNVAVMSKMINDLLDYTRTRLGTGMPVTPKPMDLRGLCDELFEQFRSANPTREVLFHADGACPGEWDVDRLRQAISNLMGNAIQHGSEDAAVGLVLSEAGDDVIVEVCNGGPPISPGDLPRIFDPLIRGADTDGPKLTRPGSIGLGLYIAREVAKSHGGRIDVTSTDADGTTFAIHLPRHSSQRKAQAVMDEEQIQRM